MFPELLAAIEDDFAAVNRTIVEQLHSRVGLAESIGHYIVEAGGKRLRPILVLLAARSCGIRDDRHIQLAAVIEFIHTATLLHDDVVDMSTLRRGRPTVNAEWNTETSVLVGDFIYSRAFQLLVGIGDMGIMEIMADTTNRIAEGEVQQLVNKMNPDITEAGYLQVIHDKTAILFQSAAQCGARLAGAAPEIEQAFQSIGRHLGAAFQLIDDALDYAGDASAMGKNIGDDLLEGKPTMPLIHAMRNSGGAESELIRNCIVDADFCRGNIHRVIEIVRAGESLAHTTELARAEAAKALAALSATPPSPYRDSLERMIKLSVERSN
ncbi:MAG: polyprenyl synthetase family protein [Gammaproteobacteria bacterium]|nr:polyprenyl synthetase family protein [Gammaproteobacteria bacterium]